jgi:hypothetical protein
MKDLLMVVLGQLVEKGDWKVKHPVIPDLKAAGQEEVDEEGSEGLEEERRECDESGGEGEQEGGRGWWSPSLEPIAEEI